MNDSPSSSTTMLREDTPPPPTSSSGLVFLREPTASPPPPDLDSHAPSSSPDPPTSPLSSYNANNNQQQLFPKLTVSIASEEDVDKYPITGPGLEATDVFHRENSHDNFTPNPSSDLASSRGLVHRASSGISYTPHSNTNNTNNTNNLRTSILTESSESGCTTRPPAVHILSPSNSQTAASGENRQEEEEGSRSGSGTAPPAFQKRWRDPAFMCCGHCNLLGCTSCCSAFCCPCVAAASNSHKLLGTSFKRELLIFFTLLFGFNLLYHALIEAVCPAPVYRTSAEHLRPSLPIHPTHCERAKVSEVFLTPLMLIGLIMGAVRRTHMRTYLHVKGSRTCDMLGWLCFPLCMLAQETRTVRAMQREGLLPPDAPWPIRLTLRPGANFPIRAKFTPAFKRLVRSVWVKVSSPFRWLTLRLRAALRLLPTTTHAPMTPPILTQHTKSDDVESGSLRPLYIAYEGAPREFPHRAKLNLDVLRGFFLKKSRSAVAVNVLHGVSMESTPAAHVRTAASPSTTSAGGSSGQGLTLQLQDTASGSGGFIGDTSEGAGEGAVNPSPGASRRSLPLPPPAPLNNRTSMTLTTNAPSPVVTVLSPSAHTHATKLQHRRTASRFDSDALGMVVSGPGSTAAMTPSRVTSPGPGNGAPSSMAIMQDQSSGHGFVTERERETAPLLLVPLPEESERKIVPGERGQLGGHQHRRKMSLPALPWLGLEGLFASRRVSGAGAGVEGGYKAHMRNFSLIPGSDQASHKD